MEPRALVPVWVIQCSRSGNFLTRQCGMALSLADAGRLHDREEALDTAITQLGYDYIIHQFWEAQED